MQARILEVLTVLSTGRIVRACDLAVRLGTSERTIRRDVAQLRYEGYRIDAAPGVGGGYIAPAGLVLPAVQFTPHEVFTLAMALRTLAGQGMRESKNDTSPKQANYVETAMHKLRSVLPATNVDELDGASTAIIASPGNEPEIPFDILVSLTSAVAKARLVDIEYRATADERRVEPYRIVVFGAHWYLLAWDLQRSDWRIFRLDRIALVHTTTFGFHSRPTPNAIEFVRHRVSQAVYETTVTVRVYAPAAEVSQRVPARAGIVMPLIVDECELVMSADAAEWLVAFLLHLGHHFTVVAPESFRDKIRQFRDRLNTVLD